MNIYINLTYLGIKIYYFHLTEILSLNEQKQARSPHLIVSDGDLVLLAGGFVAGGDIEDSVGVDIEGDFDLRDSARCGRNSGQLEFAQQVVVAGHSALTFVHLQEIRSE